MKNKFFYLNMCNKVVAILFSIVATYSFFSCAKDDDTVPLPKENPKMAESRTILAYLIAENNLNSDINTNVDQMLRGMKHGGLKANDRLVIFIDDIQYPRYYAFDRNIKDTVLVNVKPVHAFSEDFNSSESSRLQEALEFTKKHYPASSYGLVMASHGSGWIPSNYIGDNPSYSSPRRSIGLDNGMNSTGKMPGNQMNIDDMDKAVRNAGGVDFIFFDACFMECIEVAYELRNSTKYIISSPAEIPDKGADYSTMLPAMFYANDYPAEMLNAYYKTYSTIGKSYGINITAIRTEYLDNFASYMKQIVSDNKNDILNLAYSSSLNYMEYGYWSRNYPDFYDMQGIMLHTLDTDSFNKWKQEASKVIVGNLNTGYWYSGFDNSTHTINPEECCGVSMFIPSTKYGTGNYSYFKQYSTTAWGRYVWGM